MCDCVDPTDVPLKVKKRANKALIHNRRVAEETFEGKIVIQKIVDKISKSGKIRSLRGNLIGDYRMERER